LGTAEILGPDVGEVKVEFIGTSTGLDCLQQTRVCLSLMKGSVISRALPEFGSGSGSGRNPAFFLQIRLISGSGQNWAGFQILPDLENFH